MVPSPRQAGGHCIRSTKQGSQYRWRKIANTTSSRFITAWAPGLFDALVAESNARGIAVIGHGVRAVGLPEGLLRGQVMVAHAEKFYYTAFGNSPPPDARVAEVIRETVGSGAYVTPNLSFQHAIVRQWGHPDVRAEMFADPRVSYMAAMMRLNWTAPRRDYSRLQGNPMATQLEFLKRFTKALAEAGVPLLAGTDTPLIPGLLPGSGLVDEILLLQEAGLSNYEALASATRNPGDFVAKYVAGAQPFGTVAAGSRADLLLVGESPLQSLETLRSPVGVMVGGTWRTTDELTAILEQNRQAMEAMRREAFAP